MEKEKRYTPHARYANTEHKWKYEQTGRKKCTVCGIVRSRYKRPGRESRAANLKRKANKRW